MALDLRQEIIDNNANGFVEKVFTADNPDVQMANVGQAIEQARTSSNPDMQQFVEQLEGALRLNTAREAHEVRAEEAQMDSGWVGIMKEIMGPDGEFQMSDLQNLDFGKLLGALFKNLFNNEAATLQQDADSLRAAANEGVQNALGYLDRAEAGGADVGNVRALLGSNNANLTSALEKIGAVSQGAPPPQQSAPGLT